MRVGLIVFLMLWGFSAFADAALPLDDFARIAVADEGPHKAIGQHGPRAGGTVSWNPEGKWAGRHWVGW